LDPAVSTRLETWKAVLGTFAQHPIGGIGLKGTEALSRAVDINAANAHNVYIQILGELGLVGILLFGAMVGCLLWQLWRAGDQLPHPMNRMAWGLFAGVTCYLAQSMTQAEFMDLGIWTVMGLAAGLIHLSRARGGDGESAPPRVAGRPA
jgi:O-antigen ligase